jgi:uncharacterized NAD(P)/FAD-binding protein YdhS
MITGPDLGGAHSFLVIGGGFSGAAAATHLALRAAQPTRITLVEPSEHLGRGLAYGSGGEQWLLNVPAGRLSIDPARPGDFHAWALESALSSSPDAFLPRSWFGRYTAERLDQAVRSNRHVELTRVRDHATGLVVHDHGVRLATSHRATIEADQAVLALGNGPTRVPAALGDLTGDERLLHSPWNLAALERLASESQRILLVGTGLTMFDAAVALRGLGFSGDLVAISRRGQMARSHGPKNESAHADWANGLHGLRLTELLDRVRARSEAGDWRGVIDSIRPHTQRIWGGLSERDRAQFLARLAVHWDVHRHRAPPQVHAEVEAMRASGQLRVLRGHISAAGSLADSLRIRLLGADSGETTLFTDGVVLCTGPDPDPRRWGSLLVDSLLAAGVATPDAFGLGLRTDAHGRLLNRDGLASDHLATLGPLRRGDLWESTAVPEISAQAAALVGHLLGGPLDHVRTATRTTPPPAPHDPATPHHRSAAC